MLHILLRLYCIFLHYLISDTIFGKMLLKIKHLFYFLKKFV
jgi:hypothetical protein